MTSRYDASIAKFMMAENGVLFDYAFLTFIKQLAYSENKDLNPAFLFSDGSNVAGLPLLLAKSRICW